MYNFILHLGKCNIIFFCSKELKKEMILIMINETFQIFDEEALNSLIPYLNPWTDEDHRITLEHLKNKQFWFEISPGSDAMGSCDKNIHPDERYKMFSVNFDDNKILKNEFYYQVFEEEI